LLTLKQATLPSNGLIDIRCLPSNISVTGGTINVTIPASGTNARISSTAPFPNFNVNRTAETGSAAELVLQQINSLQSTAVQASVKATARPLTVLGDFTLLTGNSPLFNANNQDVTIGGTLECAIRHDIPHRHKHRYLYRRWLGFYHHQWHAGC
jgi:hypothetical protein